MKFSPLLDELIQAFQQLPGVGPKSAQRLAFHVLERNREGGLRLSKSLEQAVQHVGHCQQCRNFTEEPICHVCRDEKRARHQQLCVVETPADLLAIESSGHYFGHYFVLHGLLSPLDGIGPENIGLQQLEKLLASQTYQELILAIHPTVEGDVTAHFILDSAREHSIAVSRIAHGVPVGGDLEYVDGTTMALSFSGRQRVDMTP